MLYEWLAAEFAQSFVAASHPTRKPARKDNARYLFHLQTFVPGAAFPAMPGVLFLD
jgi:hypothetical protein